MARSFKLLDRIFGEDAVAFQRLGDQNQTLYEDPGAAAQDYWRAGANVIPLTPSRRFGPEIARFASRLTARSAQQIEEAGIAQPSNSPAVRQGVDLARSSPPYAGEDPPPLGERSGSAARDLGGCIAP